MDGEWTRGEGRKRPKMGGRPLYKPPTHSTVPGKIRLQCWLCIFPTPKFKIKLLPPHEKSVTRRSISFVLPLIVSQLNTHLVDVIDTITTLLCDFVSKLNLSHEVLLSCHV